jgi:hypothetical protein
MKRQRKYQAQSPRSQDPRHLAQKIFSHLLNGHTAEDTSPGKMELNRWKKASGAMQGNQR